MPFNTDWIKKLYDERPFGNFLVILVHGRMYVVREVKPASAVLSLIYKLEIQKKEIEFHDFNFSNYWYCAACDKLEFGGI